MIVVDYATEIVHAAKKMYAFRYEMSNGGNVSMRIPDTDLMLIKGTNVAFDEICEENLVVTDFDGKVVQGTIKPSKEGLLHGALYKAFPEVGAIMHCHSPYATAWATNHESLEFVTHHAQMKLHACPVIDTHSYVVSPEYFPEVIDAIRHVSGTNTFILRAHGQVAMGKTMRDATYLAELVEETAQIAVLSSAIRQ